MQKRDLISAIAVVVVALVLVAAFTCTYIITEREQAVITRFNKPIAVIVGGTDDFESIRNQIRQTYVREGDVDSSDADITVHEGAGLYFKMPFIDRVVKLPDTILEYDSNPEDIITQDKKTLTVDNYARWHIDNPLRFYISVRNEVTGRTRLDEVIYSSMRDELSNNSLIEIIRTTNDYLDRELEIEQTAAELDIEAEDEPGTTNPMRERIERGREAMMRKVTENANETALQRFGVRILDVRIKRAELLPGNLQAVFARMQAERSRISKGYRSEGEKEANIIRGNTDRQVEVLLAEAKREAEQIRGEGDAKALSIYAEALNQEPEFYQYLQTLEVMSKSTPAGSEFLVGLGSPLYKLLKEGHLGSVSPSSPSSPASSGR